MNKATIIRQIEISSIKKALKYFRQLSLSLLKNTKSKNPPFLGDFCKLDSTPHPHKRTWLE